MNSAYEIRQQILANALILFPYLVMRQSDTSRMPPWAPMVFEIAILPAVRDGAHGKHSRARLINAHPVIPAHRVTLLGSHADSTIGGALKSLLDVTIDALGEKEHDLCPPPPGIAQAAVGRRGHHPERPDLSQRDAAPTSSGGDSPQIHVGTWEFVGEIVEEISGETVVEEEEQPPVANSTHRGDGSLI